MEVIPVDADRCLNDGMGMTVNPYESFSMRLKGAKENHELLACQGYVPDKRFATKEYHTICYGTIIHVKHPVMVLTFRKAYQYRNRHKNLTHTIPSKYVPDQVPSYPIVRYNPVNPDQITSIEELLKDLGFKGEFHFYEGSDKTPIYPVEHGNIENFEQEYVARISKDTRTMKKIWKRRETSKVLPNKDLGPLFAHQTR